jgi:hypothetical protein
MADRVVAAPPMMAFSLRIRLGEKRWVLFGWFSICHSLDVSLGANQVRRTACLHHLGPWPIYRVVHVKNRLSIIFVLSFH